MIEREAPIASPPAADEPTAAFPDPDGQRQAQRPVAVSVEGVSKAFETGGGRRVVALDTISFDIRRGELLSLIGPSGCGKSTLLRLVSGLVAPTGGHILVNGLEPIEARRKRQFGIVFQSPVLFDWRTVDDNIGLPLQVFGTRRADIARRVGQLVEMVGLTAFRDAYPWQLSGGMQQRVSIARALSFAPPFLLMDEPFGALDLITRDRMANELLRIWTAAGDTTVLFITHSIPEAILLSDRIVVMSARPGRVLATVSIDLPRPRTEAVRESQAFYGYENTLRQMLLEAEAGHG
jgi:NitT/TauT family transport system ATP-binding protein